MAANKSGDSIKAIMSRLEDIVNKVIGTASEATVDVATEILKSAKEKAPLDTGALRASGHLDMPNKKTGIFKSKRFDVEVVFSEKYAWYQHEGLEFKHPKGGEAKYLEKSFEEHKQKFAPTVEKQARGIIK